jgi:transcriptional regulator with XRE-family HTH domain
LATIARIIRKGREEMDMSQQNLAKMIGSSQAMISHWENGRIEPTSEFKKKLSAALGVEFSLTKEGGSLGEWLKIEREKQGISRAELAKRAGIAPITLYFIETGRTESPQESTINSLKKVLGAVPSKVTKEVESEEKVGDFVFKGTFPIAKWRENIGSGTISCIYVFYDELQRPVRIGQTEDLARRMKEYESNYWWFRVPTVETFAYVTVDDSEFRRKAEKVMIKLVGANAIFNDQDKMD